MADQVATPAAAGGAADATTPANAQVQVEQPQTTPKAPPRPATPDNPDAWNAEYEAKMAEIKAKREKDAEETRRLDAARDQHANEGDGEETPPNVKTYKINGRDVTVDLSDPAKVDQYIQKGLAATEQFTEAKRIRQEAEGIKRQAIGFVEALRTNPIAVLSHPAVMGDTKAARAVVERWLYDQVQREAMPEQERQRLAEKEELEHLRTQQQEAQERQRQQQREQLKETLRKDWTQKFIQALETADLPKNDWTLSRMAQYMRVANARGHKQIQPSDVVELVRQDWEAVRRQLVSNKTGDQLIKELGEDAAAAIRKADVQRYKQNRSQATGRFTTQAEEPPRRTYGSVEEMRQAIATKR